MKEKRQHTEIGGISPHISRRDGYLSPEERRKAWEEKQKGTKK